MNSISVFAPATVANISCGYDVLGCCLNGVGDQMNVHRSSSKNVTITKIEGAKLPFEAHKNVASVAVMAMLEQLNDPSIGIDIEIFKKIKSGSGIGSSAASSAGAVWAVNELLNRPFTANQLVQFAMEGERIASGSAHADNVAPALLGGFTLVRSYSPLDVIKLHTPPDLYFTVIHPQIEVKTEDSRRILKPSLPLKNAVTQWGNLGGFISGLYTEDYDLISRSLSDIVIEPLRAILIPKFKEVQQIALENGALGAGISGSGPSIFALSKGKATAEKVAKGMRQIYKETSIGFDVHITSVNSAGVTCI